MKEYNNTWNHPTHSFYTTISYVVGKQLIVADALSWAPILSSTPSNDDFQAEVEMFVNAVIPAT